MEMTERRKRFCAWIIQERKRQFLTQEEAAEKCGVALDTIQAWEQGTRYPTPRFRARLCRGLGLDPLDPRWIK